MIGDGVVMKRFLPILLALAPGLLEATPASGCLESVTFATARTMSTVTQALDVRSVRPIEDIEEIAVAYSAVGWDFAAGSAGTVRLYLERGTLDGEQRFTAVSQPSDLAGGLTDRGTFTWLPTGLERSPYRITHEVTRNGGVSALERMTAVFDFTSAKITTNGEYREAVIGRTQPMELAPEGGWVRLGGAGEGVRTRSSGSTLAFSFTGKGEFSFDWRKTGGSVSVTLDGVTVGTLSADASDWISTTNTVAAFGSHTLVLTFTGITSADVREAAFSVAGPVARTSFVTNAVPLDLRRVYTAATQDDEAFSGLRYAAAGWEPGSADDGAEVTITATPGTWNDGQFTGSGGNTLTIAAALSGSGTVDWNVKGAAQKVYCLKHEVSKNGSVIADRTLYGYIDLTECVLGPTYEDCTAAVMAEDTYTMTLVTDEDETRLWEPLDTATPNSGLVSQSGLDDDAITTSGFAFDGAGTFSCEYLLTGGMLSALVDGVATNLAIVSEWTPVVFAFDSFGEHSVSFRHTVADGSRVSVRNAKWVRPMPTVRATGASAGAAVDLAMGVRRPHFAGRLLPFTFSHTNWTGTAGADGSSVAKVTVVELSGLDYLPVEFWSDEIDGTRRTLAETTGESTVGCDLWSGVWKAKLEILTDGSAVHTETAVFDLRKSRCRGLLIRITNGAAAGPSPVPKTVEDILLIDGADIRIYDASLPLAAPEALRWRWCAAEDPELPGDYRSAMGGFAEAKPLKGGKWIGLCGGNRWAIVSVAERKSIAWGVAPSSPHTLELLPNDVLAVAGTEGSHAVDLYSIAGERARNPGQQNRTSFHVIGGCTLAFPHGLHWDADEGKLWICGSAATESVNEGRLWKCSVGYDGSAFSLTADREWTTEIGGVMYHDAHDLRPVPGTSKLALTTVEALVFFDMDTGSWLADETLAYGPSKCLDPSANGKTFLVQLPNHSWYTDVLQLLVCDGEGSPTMYQDFRSLPGADIYKARWIAR